MPFPAGATTITLTGTFPHAVAGTPYTGRIVLTPSATLVDETNQVIYPGGGTVLLDANGTFSTVLLTTDSPDVQPDGWRWEVSEEPLTGNHRTYFIDLPATLGPTVDLSAVTEIPAPDGTGSTPPTGPAGGDLAGTYPNPELADTPTARTNLGLGNSATRNVGLLFGQIADGEPVGLTTGVITGSELNLNATDPQALDIGPTVGYIVDYTTNPLSPTVTRVSTPAQTVSLDAGSQSRALTWWLLDASGNVIQQGTQPDATQRRTHLLLGQTVYNPTAGELLLEQSLPVILAQLGNQFVDLLEDLGAFNTRGGNLLSANGTNLSLNKTAGNLFARAFNYFAGATLTKDPHRATLPAQSPVQLRRLLRTPAAATPPIVTTIDPANYDVGSVLTAVPGGANTSTIQRVWAFAANDVQDQIAIQYGQATYPSLQEARDAIGSEAYVVSPVAESAGALIGYIAVTKSATNLADTSQARIVRAGKFATP